MRTFFKNSKFILSLFLAASFLFGLQSCYKKDYTHHVDNSNYNNAATVNSSVYGIVKDESGSPIKDVVLRSGGYTAISDASGFFIFSNITTPSHNTTIVATKDSFFNGVRSLSVNENDKHFVEITMLAKGTPQVFNSQNGGTVNFSGLSITFPTDGVVLKQGKTPYTGQVYVFAKRIDPYTDLGGTSMPGDLRAINKNGVEKTLQSFGMFVAELYDVNGNALQIADTKDAEFSLTIPTNVVGIAPSTLPLWYFDETQGMWIEEGAGILNGNKYNGKVKHFSFWNCDVPMNAINLQMTLKDQNGNPLNGYVVKLINTVNNDTRYGTTSLSGWVGGLTYSNTILNLEVYSTGACAVATPLYTTTITTAAANINLGVITVNLAPVAACSFNAIVHDCLGAPLSNACVYIEPLHLMLFSNALGQINYTLPCVPVSPITLKTYDLNNNVFGTSTYTLTAGVNTLGILNACGNVTPYITINVTNTVTMATNSVTITLPNGTLNCSVQGLNSFISGYNPQPNGESIFMQVDGASVGTFNISNATIINMLGFTDTLNITGANTMDFIAFPPYPGDAQGTYQLNLIGSPSGDTYTATGTFRIPRNN